MKEALLREFNLEKKSVQEGENYTEKYSDTGKG